MRSPAPFTAAPLPGLATPVGTMLPQLSAHSGAVRLVVKRGGCDHLDAERLRYRIYCTELGFAEPNADHAAERLPDGSDDSALHVEAHLDGRLVGAMRSHPFAIAPAVMRQAIAAGQGIEGGLADSVYLSRMVIAPEHRRSNILAWIGREMVLQEMAGGNRQAFLASWDHLCGVYERLGFQRCAATFLHPLYGRLTPMVLPLDLLILAARRSPLVLGLRRLSA